MSELVAAIDSMPASDVNATQNSMVMRAPVSGSTGAINASSRSCRFCSQWKSPAY